MRCERKRCRRCSVKRKRRVKKTGGKEMQMVQPDSDAVPQDGLEVSEWNEGSCDGRVLWWVGRGGGKR